MGVAHASDYVTMDNHSEVVEDKQVVGKRIILGMVSGRDRSGTVGHRESRTEATTDH